MYKLAVLNYATRRMREDPRRSLMPQNLDKVDSLSSTIDIIDERMEAVKRPRLSVFSQDKQKAEDEEPASCDTVSEIEVPIRRESLLQPGYQATHAGSGASCASSEAINRPQDSEMKASERLALQLPV